MCLQPLVLFTIKASPLYLITSFTPLYLDTRVYACYVCLDFG
jgi:hypothetical protein